VKYINGTSRFILTEVTLNGNTVSSSFTINQPGDYTIIASYVMQYYVTTNLNVSAYINGVNESLSTGWYNRGSTVEVFPQVIPISQYEIYNITRTFNFIVEYPMSIEIPYIVEYYVKVNFTGSPLLAVVNGTNRTLVSGYYPAGTTIEIPEYEYLSSFERLEVFSQPQMFIVNEPLQVDIKVIPQFWVNIYLPNGSISGWYNNGSVIVIPKVVNVNGITYVLNGSDEIIVTQPIFLTPNYEMLVNNTQTTTNSTTTNSETTTQSSVTTQSYSTTTIQNQTFATSSSLYSNTTTTPSQTSYGTLNIPALTFTIIFVIIAIIAVVFISRR
jgi:hypothetical protein